MFMQVAGPEMPAAGRQAGQGELERERKKEKKKVNSYRTYITRARGVRNVPMIWASFSSHLISSFRIDPVYHFSLRVSLSPLAAIRMFFWSSVAGHVHALYGHIGLYLYQETETGTYLGGVHVSFPFLCLPRYTYLPASKFYMPWQIIYPQTRYTYRYLFYTFSDVVLSIIIKCSDLEFRLLCKKLTGHVYISSRWSWALSMSIYVFSPRQNWTEIQVATMKHDKEPSTYLVNVSHKKTKEKISLLIPHTPQTPENVPSNSCSC